MALAECPFPLTPDTLPGCIKAMRMKRVEFVLQFCSLSILYYDYLLTFKDEIHYIWLRKWRLSTIFYFFCRYALGSNVIYMMAISEDSTGLRHLWPCRNHRCVAWHHVAVIFVTLLTPIVVAVWTLRTRIIAGIFGTLGMVCIILLTYRVPHLQCKGMKDMSAILGANAAVMLLIEVSSFILATVRVWRSTRGEKHSTDSRRRTLNDVILGQGIATLSIGVIILNFKGEFVSRLLNGLKVPLSGFLTARFILALRIWDDNRALIDGGSDQDFDLNLGGPSGRTPEGRLPPMQFSSNPTGSILSEFGQDMYETTGTIEEYDETTWPDRYPDQCDDSNSMAMRGDIMGKAHRRIRSGPDLEEGETVAEPSGHVSTALQGPSSSVMNPTAFSLPISPTTHFSGPESASLRNRIKPPIPQQPVASTSKLRSSD
ncbi:hypothetical protein FA15DRAFT_669959 [Coprinopsis marcescibilis]|uniref:DUF6533 domain-containing protein n=1 Tax=Coprinopsis marcescibilis TaxID=230819 RepID=A0A5C3KUW9_COPMA|nr:hypothetical protein FA15DRAFT_669959 [Coprinopsis marcescibilis]